MVVQSSHSQSIRAEIPLLPLLAIWQSLPVAWQYQLPQSWDVLLLLHVGPDLVFLHLSMYTVYM